MSNLNNNKKIIVIIFVIIIVIVVYYIYNNFGFSDIENDTVNEILIKNEEENSTQNNEENEIKEVSNKIIVHIIGEVKNPGIVELNDGDRIFNAIEKAGGTTKNADTSKINLAQSVKDGMKINIPNINDESETNQNIYIENINQEEQINKKNMININTATQAELETLPGIGASTATKIINYRKEKDKFSKIEDIKNVNGIGDAKFEKIKDLICVK